MIGRQINRPTDGNTALHPVVLPSAIQTTQPIADRVLTDYVPLGLQCITMLSHHKSPPYKWKYLQYKSWFLQWDQDEATQQACEIAFAGQCNVGFITGSVSNRVVVIDCDDEATYKRFKKAFIKMFGRTRFTKSYRGGHILVRCPDTELCNAKIKDANGNDIGDLLARNKIAVLPMSTKQLADGTVFTYVDDLDSSPDILHVSIEQLQKFFKAVAPKTVVRRYTQYQNKQRLTLMDAEKQLLATQEGNRNNTLFKLTGRLLNYHHADYLLTKWLPLANQCIPDEAEQNERTILSAIESYRDQPEYQQEKQRIGDLALQAMPAIVFKGKAGVTQRAVYKALIKRSNLEVRKPAFVATYRQIQTITGIRKRQSIHKALKYLCDLGMIERVAVSRDTYHRQSSMWRWNISMLRQYIESLSSDVSGHEVGHKVPISLTTDNEGYYGYHLSDFDPDDGTYYQQCLSELSAIGRNGTTIYLYLLYQPTHCRVSAIAKALQLS